ncbi:hypothetical protein [Streptomyces sp. NPDC051567]|uniref:hypothetical protein n=1 Tax=Streptomyces sp. NPDC051567 TaxID=3365660 RepID=UPI0037A19B4A
MGIKEQFQDKARRLAEQAEARQGGARDTVPERAPQQPEPKAAERPDRARAAFDEGFGT